MNIEHTQKSISVFFSSPRRVVSSAVYGGGVLKAGAIINLRTTSLEAHKHKPDTLINNFITRKNLNTRAVGLLTAAPLEYAQFVYQEEQGIKVLSIVTAGVSNALNIAERSFTDFTGEYIVQPGTINIITITNANLLNDCMVSSVITSTEAKSAALFDLKVKSVITGKQATGTGTDSVVIVSGGLMNIKYAGGHTLFGQLMAEAVYTGVKNALNKQVDKNIDLDKICSNFDF
jgi:iron complex transport system ATP-binding protein